MGRRVTHIFDVDFDKLKYGQIYKSLCGKGYIADDPPTQDESATIAAKTKDDPVCSKCRAVKERPSADSEEK